ncbi:hypothetical protein [Burkholderia anthina]|uniref:hypothetical protein n=1 Tax=Burkholderia anthina TaxID=179879 RepID=UPI001AA0497C|nr:hypothetical protein [Burkholderia anthina]QTD94398.1 hypothetical protein J4G50_23600 [Burkholderia anthina]
MQIFHARRVAHARHPAHVPRPHDIMTPGRRRPRTWRAPPALAGQPPLAPAGAEAAPGVLAPLSLPGVPDGAVDGAADMPPVALVSELAPVRVSLSPFF